MKISINQAPKYTGQEVTIGCWLLQKRGSGKLQFLQLRDGTGFMQGVVVKANDEELFTAAKGLHQEASMYVTGTIKEDERSSFGYEMEVSGLEIIQNNEGYPITPKEHGPEFLLDNRHLWLRSRKQHAVMNIRNQIIKSTYDFYFDNGFKKIDSPILTSSSPEGTTELFHTKYFDEDAYLSQSGQLYAEAGAMAHGKVFTFGPTFRAEKSKTRRHLIEFWMIEPEMAFYDLAMNMEVAEELLVAIVEAVTADCRDELEILGRDVAALAAAVATPFPRLTYTEAVELLTSDATQLLLDAEREGLEDERHALEAERDRNRAAYGQAKKGEKRRVDAREIEIHGRLADIEEALRYIPEWKASAASFEWGADFGGSDETVLTRHFATPVIVHRYPAVVKAF